MQDYNYADEIIKDYDNLKSKKLNEEDILENIVNENFENYANVNYAKNKIKGTRDGIKFDNIIVKL